MKKVLNLSVFVSCLVGMFICLGIVVTCLGYAINSFAESKAGFREPFIAHGKPIHLFDGRMQEHKPKPIDR